MKEPVYKIHDTDSNMLLKPIIEEACRKHQVAEDVQGKLIAEGIKQFSIFSDGSVMPTGFYKTVDQFIEKHKSDKPPQSSSTKSSKELLLDEMARHARAGNMSAYRECRKRYSDCS